MTTMRPILVDGDGKDLDLNIVTQAILDELPEAINRTFIELCLRHEGSMKAKEKDGGGIPDMEYVAVAVILGAYKIMSLDGHIKDIPSVVRAFSQIVENVTLANVQEVKTGGGNFHRKGGNA